MADIIASSGGGVLACGSPPQHYQKGQEYRCKDGKWESYYPARERRQYPLTPARQTPLERSLDPRPRPFYLNPIVIGGALIALALLLKR
jgi:hypothetical protein